MDDYIKDENCIFYAYAQNGYPFKINFEVLAIADIYRCNIYFTKMGIYIFEYDGNNDIVDENFSITKLIFDIKFNRCNFNDYFCKEEKILNVDVKDVKKMMKHIKKKDSIKIVLIKPNLNGEKIKNFQIYISPENSNMNSRTEKKNIQCNDVEDKTQQNTISDEVYHFPKQIQSMDSTKVKSLLLDSKEYIRIIIQTDKYISFNNVTNLDEYMDIKNQSATFFGRIRSNEILEFPPYFPSNYKYINNYDEIFKTSHIDILTKLNGLSKYILFYAPIDNELYPLKVQILNGNLGIFTMYIKTHHQIEIEKNLLKINDGDIKLCS